MDLPFGHGRNSGQAAISYPRNQLDLLSQPGRRKTAGLLVCAGVAELEDARQLGIRLRGNVFTAGCHSNS
jgi:hypothetical protein